MSLQVYNTATRRRSPFVPRQDNQVSMYVCGVTVYDYCHLGHARAYVVWDTVRRYLEWRGYGVRYVQNITDIDDKIIRRAAAEGVPPEVITERYIAAYDEDMARLNIRPADVSPRATQFVPEIIALIQALIDQDYAYPAGGDVYYAVERFPTYGCLAGRTLEQMSAGASGRVSEEGHKRHPLDFALWKAAKPGEPAWDSPWGAGRPGWHIECSAMVRGVLGEAIDIHAGGADLIFPHHENEIAQSEPVTRQPLAKYWLHNGFVNIQGEKMSKSLGNFRTIRDVLNHYDPMALRLWILQAHYRQPIDLTPEALDAATAGWRTLEEALQVGHQYGSELGWDTEWADLEDEAIARFKTAMDEDFNTPAGLAIVFDLARSLRKAANGFVHTGCWAVDPDELHSQWQTLKHLMRKPLGFALPKPGLPQPPVLVDPGEQILSITESGFSDADIETLIAQRSAAKKAKNWAEADHIRTQLQQQGIKLIDQPGGLTRWVRE
ncbi:MAG: cysteine--tRNA ligase [Gloeomargaritaceae cyanobacterium C42_A2020_066]|nr:cysteine--tRNA ligase [Gloeomargaritaceae cyanobacterium C42_A2020_066]